MTYQEKFQKLQQAYSESAVKFRVAEEKILQVKDFNGEIDLMTYLKAQHAHLLAANAYSHFLEKFHRKNIDPNDKYKG
jgi:hypothetical protein